MNDIIFDNFYYPIYLEYMTLYTIASKDKFYNNIVNYVYTFLDKYEITFTIKGVLAKNKDWCYATTIVYNNRLYHNRVGYNTKATALMAMLQTIKDMLDLKFEKII